MGHGQDYRDRIEVLIKECSHDGKLDLGALHSRTMNLASDLTGKTDEVQYYGAESEIKARKNEIVKDLTLATHEVLGLIDKNHWNHDTEGLFDKTHDRKNSFIPIRHGQILKPGEANLNTPLDKQGIEFVTIEYLAKHQEVHTAKDSEPHHGITQAHTKNTSQHR